jgi:signal transduction histidine kinase
MVVRLLSTGTLEYVALGTASALYGVAMLGMCRVQARTLDEGFRIRFENRALLEQLTVQKAEAEAARHQAESASLAKSQFLAAASHDLRQPLYALSLFSASLDELRLGPEARSVVGNIQSSIGTMEQLFEGLLDLSKLDAGVVQPRFAPVSIDALFDRLSQYFRPIAGARGLDLRFRSDGEWVTSDPVLLEQVLGNLTSNALRATTSGGVLVAARPRGGHIRLEVWDTGIGIAQADLDRIFEEFVQVGNIERDRRKGLGLGLAIARRSAALIGATIQVSSRLGRGSCFGLAQPRCQAAPAEIPPPALPPVALLAGPRTSLPVLIIDDDPSVRTALADLLARWSVTFDAACSAEEALSLVEAGHSYGLILADHRLGDGMNGLELLAAIAARHADPQPRTALVTADFDPALVTAARGLAIPILQKPLRLGELRELLDLR